MSFTSNPFFAYQDILNRFDITDVTSATFLFVVITGGLQLTYLAPFQLLATDAADNVIGLGPLTNGQLLIGKTGGAAAPALPTGSINIVITPGPNSLSFDTIQNITTTSSPTFVTETLTGLTASQLVSTNASKTLISSNLLGTIHQIIVTGLGTGTITLSTPQDIDIVSSPTFNNLTLTGLTANLPVHTNAGKQLITALINLVTDVTGILPISFGGTNSGTALLNGNLMVSSAGKIIEGTSSSTPTFTTETLTGLTASQFVSTNASKTLISTNLLGTTNQVIVSGVGTATTTLATPQDINTISSPTFVTETLTGLAASQPVHTNAGKQLITAPISLTSDVSGVLPIANGGTNSGTALANTKLMVSSGGQIIEGTSSTNPSFSTITLTSTASSPPVQINMGTTGSDAWFNSLGTSSFGNFNWINNGAPTLMTLDNAGNLRLPITVGGGSIVLGANVQFQSLASGIFYNTNITASAAANSLTINGRSGIATFTGRTIGANTTLVLTINSIVMGNGGLVTCDITPANNLVSYASSTWTGGSNLAVTIQHQAGGNVTGLTIKVTFVSIN